MQRRLVRERDKLAQVGGECVLTHVDHIDGRLDRNTFRRLPPDEHLFHVLDERRLDPVPPREDAQRQRPGAVEQRALRSGIEGQPPDLRDTSRSSRTGVERNRGDARESGRRRRAEGVAVHSEGADTHGSRDPGRQEGGRLKCVAVRGDVVDQVVELLHPLARHPGQRKDRRVQVQQRLRLGHGFLPDRRGGTCPVAPPVTHIMVGAHAGMVDLNGEEGVLMARTSTRDRSLATFGEPYARKRASKRDPHVYVVQGTDADGSRFQIKRSAGSAAAALEAVQQAVEEARFGAAPRRVDVTMATLFERWWSHEERVSALVARGATTSRALSDSSRIKYREVWRRYLASRLGDRRVGTLTHAEVYDLLHEPRPRVDGRGDVQPKPLVDVLRALFKHAENAGLIESARNPMRGSFDLPAPRPEPKPLDVATLDVIEQHLATLTPKGNRVDALRLHDSFVLLRATGLRISELLALRVRDIDLKARSVTVRSHIARVASGDGARFAAVDGSKTASGERTVVVTQRIAEMLRHRIAGKQPDAHLFATSTGRPVVPESWRNELAREVRRINEARAEADLPLLEDVHPHRLRATVATQIVQALVEKHGLAAGLTSAQRLLGHSTTATLVHYVTAEAQVEDHSAILDALDPVSSREAKAREVVDRLIAEDAWYITALDVVTSARTVAVACSEPLDDERRAYAEAALAEHGIPLLVQ